MKTIAHILGLSLLLVSMMSAQEITKSIPSQNGFLHDFGTVSPGDVLVVHVKADVCHELVSGFVTGGSPVWVGSGLFTATATIPSSQSGHHNGTFAGKYRYTCGGGNSGSGGGDLPDWTGSAEAEVSCKIVSRAEKTTPDGTPRTRTTVAVCEKVRFNLDPVDPADWVATAGKPLMEGPALFFNWTAPETPQDVTITATSSTGMVCSIDIKVIQPEGVRFIRVTKTPNVLEVFAYPELLPQSVNFSYAVWREEPGPASDPIGGNKAIADQDPEYLTRLGFDGIAHNPSPHYSVIEEDNVSKDPDRFAGATPQRNPYTNEVMYGGFTWAIPYSYKCADNAAGGGIVFTTVNQIFRFNAPPPEPLGTASVQKADVPAHVIEVTP